MNSPRLLNPFEAGGKGFFLGASKWGRGFQKIKKWEDTMPLKEVTSALLRVPNLFNPCRVSVSLALGNRQRLQRSLTNRNGKNSPSRCEIVLGVA